MGIILRKRLSRNRQKYYYTFEFGRGKGDRKTTGAFTYAKPKSLAEREHNKTVLQHLKIEQDELIRNNQFSRVWKFPKQHLKENFFTYYQNFVETNKRPGNRHLESSFEKLKAFVGKPEIMFKEITDNFCVRFRNYLLDHLSGRIPANYFGAFKNVLYYATKEKYLETNPVEGVRSKSKPPKFIKGYLEADEYAKLLPTPIKNKEIRDAFIFSCYTGLRWCDVKDLQWKNLNAELTRIRFLQRKTGVPASLDLHRIPREILQHRKKALPNIELSQRVFDLHTPEGANKTLGKWVEEAGIHKHITWHSARLSFSILLQDANVDAATVALLLGHTSTKYVNETYKRRRPKDQSESINKLPSPPESPFT